MHEDGISRRMADHPQFIMWLCFGAVIAAAWSYLAIASPETPVLAGFTEYLRELCLGDTDPWSRKSLLAASIMWAAMVLAMMLPSAAPMVATYMDISLAAREKGEDIASPAILIAGYLLVWAIFSVAMIVTQSAMQELAVLNTSHAVGNRWIAAGILVAAGLYQFSHLKHACLNKCAQPMPWFMANWRTGMTGTFSMGVRQGIFCLGCCWALMMVMFVAGLMNLFWMAALGLVMIAEKTVVKARLVSYGSGIMLIAAGILVSTL